MRRQRIVDFLVYMVVRILICIVQAMRIETGCRLARRLAWLFCDVLRVRGAVVDDNLAHAFPEPVAGRAVAIGPADVGTPVPAGARSGPHAAENPRDQLARLRPPRPTKRSWSNTCLHDRPLLIVAAHLGNFEVGGYVLGTLGFPTYTVARTLDNPYLDQFVNRFRAGTGQHMIPKNGGYDQIVEVLARGGTMTFLADQYAGPKGCWVEFFGRPASAHKAIALLALDNDARMSVCTVRRLGRPMQFELLNHKTIDPHEVGNCLGTVRELTQWYTTRLEELIRHTPDQYWWLHRRWKDTQGEETGEAGGVRVWN